MEQKYKLGEKVKVIVEGEIREVYVGYDTKTHLDVIRYKVVSDEGTAIGVPENRILEQKINCEKYYSACCHALMPRYPDEDFCPKCKEHTGAYTADDIEKEEGIDGRLLK